MTQSGPSALVVKLGGSHADAATLRPWLAAIAASGPVLLVPGGGAFADTVRAMQPVIGYDDGAAHEMALLAMAQYGCALAALQPGLRRAGSEGEIAALFAVGAAALLSPWPWLADEPTVPASWAMTSDSIALWLACRFDAPLLLIKRAAAPDGATAASLAAAGLLDAAFPALCAGYHGALHLVGPDQAPPARLDPAALPGRRFHARAA
jgi:aspartokinase-like uncharacterized kinase